MSPRFTAVGSIAVAFVAAALIYAQQPSSLSPDSSDKVQILSLEIDWNKAHTEGNVDAFERLFAEELVVTVPRMAVMKKSDIMQLWRSGKMKFTEYRTMGTNVQLFGDSAVVYGKVKRTRLVDGMELKDNWLFTKMYVRRAGKWQVVAWHASEAP